LFLHILRRATKKVVDEDALGALPINFVGENQTTKSLKGVVWMWDVEPKRENWEPRRWLLYRSWNRL